MTFTIVGAIIGFASSGIPGAAFGLLIGMYIDRMSSGEDAPSIDRPPTASARSYDFRDNLLILIAAIMKADGALLKSELDLVKQMLVRTYGEEEARILLLRLREYTKQTHNLAQVCRDLRMRMGYSQRLEIVHVLFRISRADGNISQSELQILQMVSTQLGISTPDFLSLRAMFVSSPDSDYQILEIKPEASDEEVKKAYRKMAMRFHPDRLGDLSMAEKKQAEEKFVRVHKAYESIRKKRGMA